MSDIRTYCRECECETVHAVLEEPVVLTVGLLDCRGRRGLVKVGTEMLRCGVRQRTQPNPEHLMPMLPEAHSRMLQASFTDAAAKLTVEWMEEWRREQRWRAAMLLGGAVYVLGLTWWMPGPGASVGVAMAMGLTAAIAWMRSRQLSSFESVATDVTQRWLKGLAEADAKEEAEEETRVA